MLMHVIAHGGCRNTVTESALKWTMGEKPFLHQRVKPMSVLCLAFQFSTPLTELSQCPTLIIMMGYKGQFVSDGVFSCVCF